MTKKLLVIEDDPLLLKNTMQILTIEGYEVIAAGNGLAGLEHAYQSLPDLIISDISMPGLNGLELLAQLRLNPKTAAIPFIFLTAHGKKEDLRQGMGAGADDYLTKPFTVPDLLTAINARFERQAAYLRDQERKLDELRGNIIFILPHELRTPLMSIMGYADLLIESRDALEAKTVDRALRQIKAGGERLYRLTENYLLYVQLEVAKSDPVQLADLRNEQTKRPTEILTQVATRQATRANRSADLVLRLTDAPAVCISQDGLKKIAEELLNNAFKFSQAGTPVELETTVDSDQYRISITNEGRGMSAKEIAEVGAYMQFQRQFYEQQGSGLGLHLVRRLAEIYAGTVQIESIPDQKTTVTVTLYLYSEESEPKD